MVPSLWHENTPLVIHSAQAAGIPVVASNVAGINEVIIDGENGILFEKGNAVELSRALIRLGNDRHVVSDLSRGAKPPLTMIKYVDELDKIYKGIISNGGPK